MSRLEEELGDGEVGTGELGGEVPAIGFTVGRIRVHLGVGGDTDGELPGLADVLQEIGGVGVVTRPVR